MQDEESGRLPNYGDNDGALILPLSNCDYQDFRPVIQATQYLATGTHCYPSGPWNEELLWLFGPEALTAPLTPATRRDVQAHIGGYYTLRSSSSFVFTRCAAFRHRPGLAVMLHMDLWWRGQNVAIDAGTYSYNAPQPWANPLSHTAYHNTVTVDSLDQMKRVSRFLWLPWVCGRVTKNKRSPDGQLAYWEGAHYGYERLKPPVSHRRGIVRLGHDSWLVLDAMQSAGEHQYRLHWLFPDFAYTWDNDAGHLTLQTPAGAFHTQMGVWPGKQAASVVRADARSPRGWRAPYYGCREPALSVDAVAQACSVHFWTLFGPDSRRVTADGTSLQVEADLWRARIHLQIDVAEPLVSAVSLEGTVHAKLDLI